jgi:hypothetical protein
LVRVSIKNVWFPRPTAKLQVFHTMSCHVDKWRSKSPQASPATYFMTRKVPSFQPLSTIKISRRAMSPCQCVVRMQENVEENGKKKCLLYEVAILILFG